MRLCTICLSCIGCPGLPKTTRFLAEPPTNRLQILEAPCLAALRTTTSVRTESVRATSHKYPNSFPKNAKDDALLSTSQLGELEKALAYDRYPLLVWALRYALSNGGIPFSLGLVLVFRTRPQAPKFAWQRTVRV